MMTSDVLERYLRKELTLDDVRFQMIIKSHLEANAEIEVYKKESVLKNGLINQYKAEIERLRNLLQIEYDKVAKTFAALDGKKEE